MKRTAALLFVTACAGAPAAQPPPAVTVQDVPAPTFGPAASIDEPPMTLVDDAHALDPFYRSLHDGGRVVVTEFGDSHTAGDRLTGRMRHVLQDRFGDAGRGFLPGAGRPAIKWYEQIDAHYGTDGDWKADQGGKKDTREPYGLAGVRSYADEQTATAWIQTCDDCDAGTAAGSFEIYFLRQKDGGVLEAQVDDGDWQRIHTELGSDQGDTPVPDYAVIQVPDGPHKLTLRPRGTKEVDVFGIDEERDQPGVIVDALGIVGLQMSHLWSWDWTVISPQLTHRAPNLVILQYGTNEADNTNLDLQKFEDRYVELVGRVRTAVPDAAILMLGPPDMANRTLGKKECAKLAKDLEKRQRKARKHHKTLDETLPDGCNYVTPQQLLDVIDAEKRAADRAGVAFFDTFSAMGGAGVMNQMVAASPPLAAQDHVHFTGKGYTIWADLLLDDLMRGYAAWQKRGADER